MNHGTYKVFVPVEELLVDPSAQSRVTPMKPTRGGMFARHATSTRSENRQSVAISAVHLAIAVILSGSGGRGGYLSQGDVWLLR